MILFKIKYQGAVPRLAQRELRRLLRDSFEDAGVFWHRMFRRKHFTKAGAREYGYTPRKGEQAGRGSKAFRRSHTGRKLRQFGHTLPLVFTGQSRQLTRIRDIRATSKGVRIVMRAPGLNRRPRGGRINLREEMTRVSIRERDALVKRFDRQLGTKLRRLKASETVTIR